MKGIEFLKKIGHIEEGMISEAASPVKKSRKWNGNMIKFAGLAACIAVFVGAICVSRIGVSQKKEKGAMNNVESDTSGESTTEYLENSEGSLENTNTQEETMANQNEPISVRMIMLEGKLYTDVGKSDIEGRCGIMDGSIASSVESGQYPTQDYQSNFGSGYGFQYVNEYSIDVNIDGQWIRFETSNNGMQEEPITESYTTDNNMQEEPVTEPYTTKLDLSTEQTSRHEKDTSDETEENTRQSPDRIEISLKTDTLTSEGAQFIIFNSGYQTATTGMDFSIEKLENGTWKECEYISEDVAWQEIARILQPNENIFSADWSKVYGNLEKGTYRFKKTIYADEKKEIYCEFTL